MNVVPTWKAFVAYLQRNAGKPRLNCHLKGNGMSDIGCNQLIIMSHIF